MKQILNKQSDSLTPRRALFLSSVFARSNNISFTRLLIYPRICNTALDKMVKEKPVLNSSYKAVLEATRTGFSQFATTISRNSFVPVLIKSKKLINLKIVETPEKNATDGAKLYSIEYCHEAVQRTLSRAACSGIVCTFHKDFAASCVLDVLKKRLYTLSYSMPLLTISYANTFLTRHFQYLSHAMLKEGYQPFEKHFF